MCPVELECKWFGHKWGRDPVSHPCMSDRYFEVNGICKKCAIRGRLRKVRPQDGIGLSAPDWELCGLYEGDELSVVQPQPLQQVAWC